ncbi:MAG TPA: hypothetical protein VMB82_05550 [Acidimicrobiales bacterium]|nr:hypothetical protein [Acidimicrobiales bacterium]
MFWISIPLMALGVAIAVVPGIVGSLQDHRRYHGRPRAAETRATGSARIAARTKAGVQPVQLVAAFSDSHAAPDGPLFSDVSVRRTSGERQVLVTVPEHAVLTRQDLVPRIEEHLKSTDLFEDVSVMQPA